MKTLWPIACREFLFLPEFKIRNNELKENYEIIEFVAKGNFGKVYKVQQRTATSQIFALKVLEKSKVKYFFNSNLNSCYRFHFPLDIDNPR